MFNFFQKDDARIRQDVKNELLWDPSITSGKIDVVSNDGVVTLSGSVPHYSEKCGDEKATQRVGGVQAVADEIKVNLDSAFERSDADIAVAAHDVLKWDYQVPEDTKVSVDRAWITLRGEAEWDYERTAAKDAVSSLVGVRGVTNEMKLKTRVQALDVKSRIEEALKRSAETEGRNISVEVNGDKVTLSGKVNSLSEIDDARLAAWNAPGVMHVEDTLKIAQ